jgi:hypothetical protein
MKVGKLLSWSNRGFGIVAASITELYFLHASQIVEFPEGMITPPLGSFVYFDIGPAVNGGKHLQALHARINPPFKATAAEGGAL